MHAAAGCVAVAISQIMVYHQHPKTVSNVVVPWHDMISAYMSAAVKGNVATLLRDVGDRLNNDWGIKTGATMYRARRVISDYGYDASDIHSFEYNGAKSSIDNNRPMYVSGVDPAEGGHAWVIHGYSYSTSTGWDWIWCPRDNRYYKANQYTYARTTYQCNWGYNGDYDGLFHISDMSPGESSYTRNLKMITNIRIK